MDEVKRVLGNLILPSRKSLSNLVIAALSDLAILGVAGYSNVSSGDSDQTTRIFTLLIIIASSMWLIVEINEIIKHLRNEK